MKTTVSRKGQITIPKPLRVRLGLRAGEVLEVEEENGRLVISRQLAREDGIDKLYGVLKLGRPTDAVVEELRGRRKHQ